MFHFALNNLPLTISVTLTLEAPNHSQTWLRLSGYQASKRRTRNPDNQPFPLILCLLHEHDYIQISDKQRSRVIAIKRLSASRDPAIITWNNAYRNRQFRPSNLKNKKILKKGTFRRIATFRQDNRICLFDVIERILSSIIWWPWSTRIGSTSFFVRQGPTVHGILFFTGGPPWQAAYRYYVSIMYRHGYRGPMLRSFPPEITSKAVHAGNTGCRL